ncbi:hypothetical protein [Treponema sp. Marseille-Q4523]|uniref:hypothetical protein n=1 Tax=Treponema sp. Marseille-Q4523 TaxID=2810610 RepID=UPI00195FF699|nr:hypothetical protein [Treponema sp. Marseille-Q4523]MBM7022859.1 hypothetical protein [Treponema sp. Marseille-Q4523]
MARERTAGYFIFNAVFASLLILFIVFAVRFANCFGAAERLPSIERYEIMRILIYGTSVGADGETVSASVSILDTSGNECARIERSWRGSVLAVDFKSAEFSGKRFYFPCELYGREIVSASSPFFRRRGTELFRYYNENKQCMLLGASSPFERRRDLYALARFALSPFSAFAAGFSRGYSADLAQCRAGVHYSVIVGTDGILKIEATY